MRSVSVIGAGRLGTCLAAALTQKGFRIKALSCRTISSVRESQKIIGQGKASTNNLLPAKEGQLIFICVPDDQIKKIAEELVTYNINWEGKAVFHCSGLQPASLLERLKKRGALTASFHPVQSFPRKIADAQQFEGIYCGLEGDSKALSLGEKIAAKLGARVIFLKPQDKPVYHTACSLSSNLLIVLLNMAVSCLAKLNLQEHEAISLLFPLLQRTIHNVKGFNIGPSLTGPAIRGDLITIKKHLEALSSFPQYQTIYSQLTLHALQIADQEKKLSRDKIKALTALLEGE